VPAAAQRRVHHHASVQTGKQLDDFIREYWFVVTVLGHPQPFNRDT
jgi:hypothetical protein